MADRYCGGYAQPCLFRISQVDNCTGAPIPGPTAYAFDGVRSASWEPVLSEAETAEFKSSCGDIVCENNLNCDQLRSWEITFEKCTMPFELFNLLTGQPIVTDTGETVGWYDSSAVNCQPRIALEMWQQTLDCTEDLFKKTVFPFVKFSFPVSGAENDLIEFATLTARADRVRLNEYGDGPFNDDDVLGWAALADTVYGTIGQYVTNATPPVAACGLLTVPAQA